MTVNPTEVWQARRGGDLPLPNFPRRSTAEPTPPKPATPAAFGRALAREGSTGVEGQALLIPAAEILLAVPSPTVGAYYKLASNLADAFENFPNAVTAAPASYNNRRLSLVEGNYLTPVDYDARGLLGEGGSKYWEVGGRTTLPRAGGGEQYLFFAGSATQHVCVYEFSGRLCARFRNNAYSRTLDGGWVQKGVEFGWRFVYDPAPPRRTLHLTTVVATAAPHRAEVLGDVARQVGEGVQYELDHWTPAAGQAITFGRGLEVDGSKTSDMLLSEIYIRNVPMKSEALADACVSPAPYTAHFSAPGSQSFREMRGAVSKVDAGGALLTVPKMPAGEYMMEVRKGPLLVARKPLEILHFQPEQTPLRIDFTKDSPETIRAHLMAAHKGWGGANGGVISENVVLTGQGCQLFARGDLYTGPLQGVDNKGRPNGFNKRIGACLVTRGYFGPGRYRFLVRSTVNPGVCNAVWTFHYEEAYPGEPKFDEIKRDGLHIQGGAEPRLVRNHEIDIEYPTALKGDVDQEAVSFLNGRFNTWQGELTSADYDTPGLWKEYTDTILTHGVQLNDGQLHEIGFDWHLGPSARVEFFIDGQLITTNTDNVPDIPGRLWLGVWFPSGSVKWAGKGSAWDTDHMLVKSMTIEPFASEGVYQRNIGESFPNDVYREIP